MILAILAYFGLRKKDKSVIPKGMYCYTPLSYSKDSLTYHIKPCRYYGSHPFRLNSCLYVGAITSDPIFDDQCKICGENY